jgi:hypothetical protein
MVVTVDHVKQVLRSLFLFSILNLEKICSAIVCNCVVFIIYYLLVCFNCIDWQEPLPSVFQLNIVNLCILQAGLYSSASSS